VRAVVSPLSGIISQSKILLQKQSFSGSYLLGTNNIRTFVEDLQSILRDTRTSLSRSACPFLPHLLPPFSLQCPETQQPSPTPRHREMPTGRPVRRVTPRKKILETKCSDGLIRQVVLDMMDVCAEITDALRVNLVTVEGSSNVFGDSQLSVDVRCKKCCRTKEITSVLRSA
jgi:hypothetical protein